MPVLSICALFCALPKIKQAKDRQYIAFPLVAKCSRAKERFGAISGAVVRKHRTSGKTTQEQLSERADIDVRMIRLVETKGQNLSVNLAECMARALGISLSQMIREAEDLRRQKAASKP